jgi:acyl-coenzyme A thioesterase PaaI-like protein
MPLELVDYRAVMLATLMADRGKRNFIRLAWDSLQNVPGGTRVFSRLVGLAAPYTSTIHAHVVRVAPGRAEVTMSDRREVRNHIDCIHAVALANLVELTGNTALAYSLPDDARFIVSKMSLEYLKKARGTIRAIGTCEVPTAWSAASPRGTSERRELDVNVDVLDASGALVTRGTLVTLVGPKKR